MPDEPRSLNFIEEIIEEHARTGRFGGRVHTRFPPEPNGYLHIGHAKSICLNFGLAHEIRRHVQSAVRRHQSRPRKKRSTSSRSKKTSAGWGSTGRPALYASDYFEQIYDWAIAADQSRQGVCLRFECRRDSRISRHAHQAGQEQPFPRSAGGGEPRSVRADAKGRISRGRATLRAKIDMAHPNLNMRDPVMYRILHAEHHRTGDKWCIYPMYDWTHGQSDSIEDVTHSICTLEFENHRPLYDWYLDQIAATEKIIHPQQIEFARLNLTYTVMSKRRLLELVRDKHVSGWDDPRMPTICGLRRRGYTPESIRMFCDRIGVAKFNSTIDMAVLENCGARRSESRGSAADGGAAAAESGHR